MARPQRDQDLAASAFQILNDLLGEIHAGRIVGCLALKTPSIFGTKHPQYLIRMGIGAIVIALYKFEDLWKHQLLALLTDQAPARGAKLITQLKKMKLREFRSLFIAHYSDDKKFPKPAPSKLEDLIKAQGFATDQDMFAWTQDVLEILEEIRNRLQAKFKLEIQPSYIVTDSR